VAIEWPGSLERIERRDPKGEIASSAWGISRKERRGDLHHADYAILGLERKGGSAIRAIDRQKEGEKDGNQTRCVSPYPGKKKKEGSSSVFPSIPRRGQRRKRESSATFRLLVTGEEKKK